MRWPTWLIRGVTRWRVERADPAAALEEARRRHHNEQLRAPEVDRVTGSINNKVRRNHLSEAIEAMWRTAK